jgi:hypothetical protein
MSPSIPDSERGYAWRSLCGSDHGSSCKQGISFGYGHFVGPVRDLLDIVPSTRFAFRDDTEIEPWPPIRNDQGRHLGIVHPNPGAIAGNARPRHFKDRGADLVSVPNANLIVGEAFNSEILSKLSVLKVISTEFPLPMLRAYP